MNLQRIRKALFAFGFFMATFGFNATTWADGRCGVDGNMPCAVTPVFVSGGCGAYCGSGGGGTLGMGNGGGSPGNMANVGLSTSPGRPTFPIPAGANTRTRAECGREQRLLDTVMTALSLGKLQGEQIMKGVTLGDAALTKYGTTWDKYQYVATYFVPYLFSSIMITLHYEYNPTTGQYTSPPHFVSPSVKNCAEGG